MQCRSLTRTGAGESSVEAEGSEPVFDAGVDRPARDGGQGVEVGADVAADGITGGGVAHLHAKARFAQPGEELLLAGGSGEGLADGFAERLAWSLGSAGAFGLEAFGAGGVLGGGAVSGMEAAQAQLPSDGPAFGLGLAWACFLS